MLDGRSRRPARLVVEGVNRVYKHMRRSQKNPQGGRLSKEMPIQLSNVHAGLPGVRQARPAPGARFRDDGSKERFCKKCNASVGVIAPAQEGPRSK